MSNRYIKLCLVTAMRQYPWPQYQRIVLAAIRGGITSIQLREKPPYYPHFLKHAMILRRLCRHYDVSMIVNDDVPLALRLDADGVHLGQSDMSPMRARRLLGHDKIIGYSVDHTAHVHHANDLPIDYIAPTVFPSQSKANCVKYWGLHGLAYLRKHSHYPIMAIGGINETNTANVITSGAHGVAVIGAIHRRDEPAHAAAQLRQAVDDHCDETDSPGVSYA